MHRVSKDTYMAEKKVAARHAQDSQNWLSKWARDQWATHRTLVYVALGALVTIAVAGLL